MDFGSIQIVTKTFERTVNNPRGQNYEGIKFRRYESNKVESKGEIIEVLTFSNKLFDSLKLVDYALTQANTPNDVLILVLDDQTEVEPIAKFMRQSYLKKDGSKQVKGKSFSNSYLIDALVDKGLLKGEGFDNQYLALVDITKEVSNIPAHVHGVYRIIVDESVDREVEDEDEEEEGTTTKAPATAPVAATADNF